MPSLRSGITSGLGLCIRPYRYASQLVRRYKQLLESYKALCCVLLGTHYLPIPYIQPKDAPLSLFVWHTTCIYCTHLVLLSLSTLLFSTFVLTLTLLLMSSWVLASVQAINCTFGLVFARFRSAFQNVEFCTISTTILFMHNLSSLDCRPDIFFFLNSLLMI